MVRMCNVIVVKEMDPKTSHVFRVHATTHMVIFQSANIVNAVLGTAGAACTLLAQNIYLKE